MIDKKNIINNKIKDMSDKLRKLAEKRKSIEKDASVESFVNEETNNIKIILNNVLTKIKEIEIELMKLIKDDETNEDGDNYEK